MILELFSQLGENSFHLAVLLSNDLHNFFDLRVYIMTELASSVSRFCGDFSDCMSKFFVGSRKSLLEIVDIIDNLMSYVARQFLEVKLSAESDLDF